MPQPQCPQEIKPVNAKSWGGQPFDQFAPYVTGAHSHQRADTGEHSGNDAPRYSDLDIARRQGIAPGAGEYAVRRPLSPHVWFERDIEQPHDAAEKERAASALQTSANSYQEAT
jgi:hypothetical protein